MAKKTMTSFELTAVTAPTLDKLKLANWDIKEVVNAGILMFSQADVEQQRFFVFMATKGLDLEHNKDAREIFRKWILGLVADAQAYEAKMKQPLETKKSGSG